MLGLMIGGMASQTDTVVARDGSLALPPDVLETVPPGSLLQVRLEDDGSIRLVPQATNDEDSAVAAADIESAEGRAS